MSYKKIIIFTLGEYNKNKEKDGYIPQKGIVINVFTGPNLMHAVAVGFP